MNTAVAEFSPSVLPPCSLSLVMVRATRTTSPLWRWTLATGRWSTLQMTRRKTFTSTCAGRWCSREVSVHTCLHSVKPTVKMKHPTTTVFLHFLKSSKADPLLTIHDRLMEVSLQCCVLYESWRWLCESGTGGVRSRVGQRCPEAEVRQRPGLSRWSPQQEQHHPLRV